MLTKMRSAPQGPKDDQLRKELLSMKKNVLDALRDRVTEERSLRRLTRGRSGGESRVGSLDRTVDAKRQKGAMRLCAILRNHGFPGKSIVGDDGVSAAFYLIKQFVPLAEQIQLVPVINAATDKGELPKNDDYAAFVDRLRVSVGLKQLYGTQAFVRGNFLVLAPIANESTLNERREQFKMAPLEDYLKYLELLYRMPLIRERSSGPPSLSTAADKSVGKELETLDAGLTDDEVIRVDTELVDLNVHVASKSPGTLPPLRTSDFRVLEDGIEQEVTLFNKTDTPFDLVVLIDMSGSTSNKLGLVRRATRKFIDTARPGDRVSIITFSDRVKVVCPLTSDRTQLIKSLDKIDDIGFSFVWDGLLFALQKGFGDRPPGRRRAVVMMSDGVDNALGRRENGSKTSFAQLVEAVRSDDSLVIPVYLDTFDPSYCRGELQNCDSAKMYSTARETLSVLAEESGGQVYYAKKFEDLEGVYQTVLADLGTLYSVGYTPTNEKRGGRWRTVKVEIRGHPELVAHTRRGYYAKK